MLRILPIAIILVLCGIIIGLNMQATPDASLVPLSQPMPKINPVKINEKLSQLQTKIEELEASLNTEIKQHKNTITQLSTLQLALKTQTDEHKTDDSGESKKEEKMTLTDVKEPRLTEAQRNKNILVQMGIDNDNANRIQRLAEKKEMDQLYLRNTASREGWFGTEKYFEKTRELDLQSNIYRDELGDDKYDMFLYASQLTNRITIQSVLSESPAEIAGLQSGDFILSYNNKRVFNWSDLTALTANGEVGESVPIEVQRENQTFQYFITRGPLGIRLNSERVNPNLP